MDPITVGSSWSYHSSEMQTILLIEKDYVPMRFQSKLKPGQQLGWSHPYSDVRWGMEATDGDVAREGKQISNYQVTQQKSSSNIHVIRWDLVHSADVKSLRRAETPSHNGNVIGLARGSTYKDKRSVETCSLIINLLEIQKDHNQDIFYQIELCSTRGHLLSDSSIIFKPKRWW